MILMLAFALMALPADNLIVRLVAVGLIILATEAEIVTRVERDPCRHVHGRGMA